MLRTLFDVQQIDGVSPCYLMRMHVCVYCSALSRQVVYGLVAYGDTISPRLRARFV